MDRLTPDQVSALCQGFVAVAGGAIDYAQRLRSAGFRAFEPYQDFLRSFAKNTDERELHGRIEVERAKMLLGRPWPPLDVRPEYRRPFFSSPLLGELMAERDRENKVAERELEKTYGVAESLWRREIDPCRKWMAQFRVSDRELYEATWAGVVDAMKVRVQEEAVRFASELSQAQTFDRDGRYRLFSAVVERDAAPLGFRYDKQKSRTRFPVFSSAVAESWDLCWALEEPDMFFWSPFDGRFDPFLEIRHRARRGSIRKAEPGEFLQIRYTNMVSGFFNAYRSFHDSAELETVIKAHLYLYAQIAPQIRQVCEVVLEDDA